MATDANTATTTVPQRSLAERLFGEEPTQGQGNGETRTTEPQRRPAADVLFGAPRDPSTTATAKPVEPRRKTAAEILFSEHAADYLNLTDNLAKLADHEGLTAQQQADERREFADVTINELGLPNTDAQRLHDIVTEARLKGGTEEWAAQTERWLEQSRTQLRERYGPEEADAVVKQLDAYAEAHPRLKKFLEHGVGRHPRIVSLFAEHARRVRR